jgi:DNA helicase II / ATP-dependent DNA helicase PcrA
LQLLDDLGSPRPSRASSHADDSDAGVHYNYEDEDQSAGSRYTAARKQRGGGYSGPKYNSIENIAEFFASRGKKFPVAQIAAEAEKGRAGKTAFRPGQRVRHPKYGEGVVYQREGDGESAKITVQFPRFGLKKLVEKYAQLERA